MLSEIWGTIFKISSNNTHTFMGRLPLLLLAGKGQTSLNMYFKRYVQNLLVKQATGHEDIFSCHNSNDYQIITIMIITSLSPCVFDLLLYALSPSKRPSYTSLLVN